MEDKWKLKIIRTIDNLSPHFKHTTYYADLNKLRQKYIYKDISTNEFKKDYLYLRNISNLKKYMK